jgi:alpha-tubulin suppressor-like RCC1 family protein
MASRRSWLGRWALGRVGLALVSAALVLLPVAAASAAGPGGGLYAFGWNHYGQLGNATNNGTDTANPTPTLVGLPGQNGPVTQIAAGEYHSLAVTSSGQLYAFGSNASGELGSAASATANPTPALVTLPGQSGAVTQIAAGENYSLVATSSGQLYAFGDNVVGQLGSTTNNTYNMANPTPALVTLPDQNGTVIQIAVGGGQSLVATSSGQLYAFGWNDFGQLGNATNNGSGGTFNYTANPTPALVTLPAQNGPVTQIAAGYYHSLAVTSSGQLYAFGANLYGQLGNATNNGTENANPTPAPVALPAGTKIDTVANGSQAQHTLVVVSSISGGGGGGGTTTTTTTSFGDQSITLTTPSACVAAGGKLPVTLNSKSVAHKKPKLNFKLAQFYIDKGRKRTTRVKKAHKVDGKTVVVKKHGKPVFVKKTVFLPNATAHHVIVNESLSIAGLTPGTHTLRVKIFYKKTTREHGKKHTRIVSKTLKVTFTIC